MPADTWPLMAAGNSTSICTSLRNSPTTMSGERLNGTITALTSGFRLEQFGAEILRAADRDGADIELAGIGLGVLDEIAERLVFGIGIDREHQIEAAERRRSSSNCVTGSNGSFLNAATLIAVPLVTKPMV